MERKPLLLSSAPERNLEENQKLTQKLIALERDFKNFQNSEKGSLSHRFSNKGSNLIARFLEHSPRTLMSSLQTGEGERKETFQFKGRSLLGEFEEAIENREPLDRESSKKRNLDDGSCSSSCLSDEEGMRERVEGDERRREFIFDGFFVMVSMGIIILGILYMIRNVGVYGDEEVMLVPT